MHQGIASRLTFSNVVSVVALFVALGGVGYAAATIGAGDIKENAVRSKHVKDATLTNQDIADTEAGNDDVNAEAVGGAGIDQLVQGGGRIERVDLGFQDPDGAGGQEGPGPGIGVPSGVLRGFCVEQASAVRTTLTLDNGNTMHVWLDAGGTDPSVANLDTTNGPTNDDSGSSAPALADRLIWSGSSPQGQFTAVLLTSFDGPSGCSMTGFVVKPN